MRYKSTLSNNLVNGTYAITKGLADDSSLFVPQNIPYLNYKELLTKNYQQIAFEVLKLFFSDFEDSDLVNFIEKAYNTTNFETQEIAQIKDLNPVYFLELYHGKTLAFKDFALAIFPYLLKYSAEKEGIKEKIVILTATSGDTGKAVLEAFSDLEPFEVIILYPAENVSYLQMLQMTTSIGKNIHVFAIDGNFDDAQRIAKEIFSDKEFIQKMKDKGFVFTSANSINIGRLIPQIIYYFYSYLKLLEKKAIKEDEKVNFVVPTGNFGNILACYYSKKMGLPINTILCASNQNNILYQFFTTGELDFKRDLLKTTSPSMDIIVPSNFERFLYDISSEDSEIIVEYKQNLKKGKFILTKEIFNKIDGFFSSYADDIQTISAINRVYNNYNYLMDPHTAVAYKVYEDFNRFCEDLNCLKSKGNKTIIVSTASPFKFPKAILSAIGGFSFAINRFNDLELAFLLSQKVGIKVPSAISELKNKPILHKITLKKEKVKDLIEDIL